MLAFMHTLTNDVMNDIGNSVAQDSEWKWVRLTPEVHEKLNAFKDQIQPRHRGKLTLSDALDVALDEAAKTAA